MNFINLLSFWALLLEIAIFCISLIPLSLVLAPSSQTRLLKRIASLSSRPSIQFVAKIALFVVCAMLGDTCLRLRNLSLQDTTHVANPELTTLQFKAKYVYY